MCRTSTSLLVSLARAATGFDAVPVGLAASLAAEDVAWDVPIDLMLVVPSPPPTTAAVDATTGEGTKEPVPLAALFDALRRVAALSAAHRLPFRYGLPTPTASNNTGEAAAATPSAPAATATAPATAISAPAAPNAATVRHASVPQSSRQDTLDAIAKLDAWLAVSTVLTII